MRIFNILIIVMFVVVLCVSLRAVVVCGACCAWVCVHVYRESVWCRCSVRVPGQVEAMGKVEE